MPNHEPTNILAAFEMLMEEIESEVESMNRVGAQAFADGDYDLVDTVRQQADKVTQFRDKTRSLRREWSELAGTLVSNEDEVTVTERRNMGRLQRGVRTPEEAFREPVLRALRELGGSAPSRDVLALVHDKMKGVLKDVDYEKLASTPGSPRWRNTEQWTRNTLVKEGLMRSDSPHGTWEISEAGLRALEGGDV